MRDNTVKTLVIIPCYNEEENILAVVRRLQDTCPEADYLVVNDCSTDRSREILSAAGCRYLDLPVNLGIGGAVQSGYRYAMENGYDVTVQMDGDGQHDPAYLAAVVAPVVKTTGIAILTRLAAELCRDAKESGIAAFVETAGAACALCAALPLLETVLDMVTGLL